MADRLSVDAFFPYENIDLNECLSYDFKSSLIDLYVDFIIFLPQLLVSYKDDLNFLKYLGTIVKNINDERLRKYGVLVGVVKEDYNTRTLLRDARKSVKNNLTI